MGNQEIRHVQVKKIRVMTRLPSKMTRWSNDIAAAKSTGKAWATLDSGIYHKSGHGYGKTKTLMTEQVAKPQGTELLKRNRRRKQL